MKARLWHWDHNLAFEVYGCIQLLLATSSEMYSYCWKHILHLIHILKIFLIKLFQSFLMTRNYKYQFIRTQLSKWIALSRKKITSASYWQRTTAGQGNEECLKSPQENSRTARTGQALLDKMQSSKRWLYARWVVIERQADKLKKSWSYTETKRKTVDCTLWWYEALHCTKITLR